MFEDKLVPKELHLTRIKKVLSLLMIGTPLETSIEKVRGLKDSCDCRHILYTKTFASTELSCKDLLHVKVGVLARFTSEVFEINKVICYLRLKVAT